MTTPSNGTYGYPQLVPIGPQPVQACPALGKGSFVTFYNQDEVNVISLSPQQWALTGVTNAIPLQPLTPITLPGSRSWYASGPAGTVNLLTIPGGSQLGPSPVQIAAQIALKGITVTTITTNTVIVIGSQGGIFEYSPSQALGNLVSSNTAEPGIDSEGNAYLAGETSYEEIAGVWTASQNFGAAITFYTAPGPGGPWTVIAAIAPNVTGGGNLNISATDDITLSSPLIAQDPIIAQDSITVSMGGIGVIGGTVTDNLTVHDSVTATGGTQAAPTLITTDTDHGLGSLGVANLTIAISNYTLLPDGGVFVSIKGHATGAVAAGSTAFPNAITAALRPVTATMLAGGVVTPASLALAEIGTGGVVTLFYPALVNGNLISIQGRFDLQ